MTGCFTFRFSGQGGNARPNLVLYFSTVVSANVIAKAIKSDVEQNLLPCVVFIVAAESRRDELLRLFDDSSLMSEFESLVGVPSEKLKLLHYTPSGEVVCSRDEQPVLHETKNDLLQGGMIDIFKRRQGLIASSPNYHFLKPSGDHCDSFIRASNLLISGDEVSFLAISLLPYLRPELKRIYVDTSSISYLVCKAILMSGRYSNEGPLVESFESYAVFNQSFDFVEDRASLILISATTSGSMAAKLFEKTNFERKQVVTLFYSRLLSGQYGVFDISRAVISGSVSYKPTGCPLCSRGSRLIRIVGDQFLPETPAHEQLLIRKTDFNKNRSDFFREFATQGILKWSISSDNQASSKEHFFIDVSRYLEKPSSVFKENFEKKVKKYFSRDVTKVVALDDPGSHALSAMLKGIVGANGESICWSNFSDSDESSLKNSASVVVVAGAITSGRKLLDASRKLRCISESSSILYLVGFSKLPVEADLVQLRNDLQLGGHELVVLNKCPMPRIKDSTRTAWDVELEELSRCSNVDPLSSCLSELPPILASREDALQNGANGVDQLFLPALDGKPLKLRQTFAFWSELGLESQSASQADVYWTMQAIIHDLRSRSDEKGLASTYHATVISPACFDRYNDGVIQACLLRAASPLELNYSVDDDFSRRMTDVIFSVLDNYNSVQGEAALEFLIALWTGRLQLNTIHVKEIIDRYKGHDLPDEMRFLVAQLASKSSRSN
jgi:hypothetical protein